MRDCIDNGLARLVTARPAGSSLLNGRLGLVTLYAYAYKLLADEHLWDLAAEHLAAVMSELEQSLTSQQPDVSTITSLGQLLPLLNRDHILELELGKENWQLFDELVFVQTRQQLRAANTDFLAGAAGGLRYLGTRLTVSAAASQYLQVLLGELTARRLEDGSGIRFANSYIEQLNASTAINMGYAHGHWGLLMVLLQLFEAGSEQHRLLLLPLVDGMLAYALNVRRTWPDRAKEALFPHAVPTKVGTAPDYNGFVGWCYGDLVAALVLYRVHRVLGRPDIHRVAVLTGARACGLPLMHPRTLGTDLCHGSASLVSCCEALYRMHPRHCYTRARTAWLAYTVSQLQQQQNLPQQDASLLNGLAGTLLTLISALPGFRASWPALLLLDVPSLAMSKSPF